MSQKLVIVVRRSVALPIYIVALLLDFLMLYFLSERLGRTAAYIANDQWPS
jgi:hypothetical protein